MTTRHVLAVAGLIAALVGGAASASAHGGHEDAPASPPPPASPAEGPGIAAQGEVFEVVAKPAANGMLLFLAEIDSNRPVAGAAIEVEATGAAPWQGMAEATGSPGIYALPWSPVAAPSDLTLTVQAGEAFDLLLLGGLARPAPVMVAAEPPATPADWRRWTVGGGSAGAALLALTLLARSRRRAVVAGMIAALSLMAAGAAWAHSGHDHGAEAGGEIAIVPGRPVAMDKEAQFLLGIRTMRAEAREVADSVRLVGRVVPDPSGYARVQPAQEGRLAADPRFPLPVPGQAVKRGAVLAILEPNLTTLERSDQRAALYAIETEMAQIERQLRRWEQMGDAARRKDVEDARLELERLRKQRGQIADTALGRERLIAPIDGRVTDVHVVPGEVLGPQTTVVEIVDPARLRVEAVLHDLSLADAITGGTATTRLLKDQAFPLRLIGSGGRIDPQDQGLHLIFAVEQGAEALRLGLPVDVYATTGTSNMRVAVPRDAVADAGGRPLVLVKTAPEAFEARPVTLGRSLGEWIEVAAGIGPGERVVVQGALQLLASR